MKCLLVALVINSVICVAYSYPGSETGIVERVDVSKGLLWGLKLDPEYVDNLDVTKAITNGVSPLDDVKLSSAVVYKIYGTLYEQNPDAPFHDRFKKYDGSSVSPEAIAFSKKYLMMAANGHPNVIVRSMSIFSLGQGFVENKDVVLWLHKVLFDPTVPSQVKSRVLEALINAAGKKYEYMTEIAIKACLQSDEMALRIAVPDNLLSYGMHNPAYLKDLIASYLIEDNMAYIDSLNRLLMTYGIDEVNEYKEIIVLASDIDSNRKAWMRPLINWLYDDE